MTARVGYVLGALILGIGALVGVQFSSATFTDDSSTPAQVTAARDWTPPTISVNDPGFVVSGTVSITATAADADTSVASVDIQYRRQGLTAWQSICIDADGSPWGCSWNTTAVTDGVYDLRAIATDIDGNTETSATITTDVFNTAGIVLDPIPNPTRGVVTLTARLVNVGSGSSNITFQYRVTGTSSYATVPSSGCSGSGPTRSCSIDTSMGGSNTYDWRAMGTKSGTTYYDVQNAIVVDNGAPTVSLSVPTGAMSGTVALTASASDSFSGVKSVLFESRRQGAGYPWVACGDADTTSPYACDLDSTTLNHGSTYDVRATAQDAAGNTTTTAVQSRLVDNTGPTLSFAPPSGTLSGTVNLTATATDISGVASVTFQYQLQSSDVWVTCGTPDTSSPYSCSLGTTTMNNGTYQFRAVANDNVGQTTISTTGTATVMNVSVDLATPPAAVGGGSTQLTATWNGPGTPSVIFERALGAGSYATICTVTAAPTATCAWDTSTITQGSYNVRARVVVSGTTYADLHTMYVDRTAPTAAAVSVPAAPLNGTIQVTGTAADALSGVGSMLFEYKLSTAGTWTTCGSDNSSPYSCSLDTTTLTDASYNFRATAYDLAGNTRVSATETRAVNTAVSSVSVASPTAGSTVQGTTTVTADATSTKPITSVTLQQLPPGGSWTTICVDTAPAPYACSWNTSGLARGTYQLRAVLTQANTYTVTSAAVSVTVERFRGFDVQATSGSNTGLPGAGDTVTLTYTGLANLSTISPGWNGSSRGVTVRMMDKNVDGGLVGDADYMTFGTANLGQVAFSLDYVSRNRTVAFGDATMVASTQMVSGVQVTVVTITLNAPSSDGNRLRDSNNSSQAMRWTPSATVTDTTGNAADPTMVTESGALDADL